LPGKAQKVDFAFSSFIYYVTSFPILIYFIICIYFHGFIFPFNSNLRFASRAFYVSPLFTFSSSFNTAMSNKIFTFATFVANKYIHLPHCKNMLKNINCIWWKTDILGHLYSDSLSCFEQKSVNYNGNI